MNLAGIPSGAQAPITSVSQVSDMFQPTYMKLVFLLLAWLVATPVLAEYDAAELGKLFTDREQRSKIDAARSGRGKNTSVRQTSKVNMNGYLTRSDGKSVVWVNDESTLESSRVGDVRVHGSSIGKNKRVTISVDGKTARLKPGETWHKETGEIVDQQ